MIDLVLVLCTFSTFFFLLLFGVLKATIYTQRLKKHDTQRSDADGQPILNDRTMLKTFSKLTIRIAVRLKGIFKSDNEFDRS